MRAGETASATGSPDARAASAAEHVAAATTAATAREILGLTERPR
jgi:hypothetical protein